MTVETPSSSPMSRYLLPIHLQISECMHDGTGQVEIDLADVPEQYHSGIVSLIPWFGPTIFITLIEGTRYLVTT